MTNELRCLEALGNEDAKQKMDALFLKMLMENKNGVPLGISGKLSEFDQDKPIAQIMNESFRAKRKLAGLN